MLGSRSSTRVATCHWKVPKGNVKSVQTSEQFQVALSFLILRWRSSLASTNALAALQLLEPGFRLGADFTFHWMFFHMMVAGGGAASARAARSELAPYPTASRRM